MKGDRYYFLLSLNGLFSQPTAGVLRDFQRLLVAEYSYQSTSYGRRRSCTQGQSSTPSAELTIRGILRQMAWDRVVIYF